MTNNVMAVYTRNFKGRGVFSPAEGKTLALYPTMTVIPLCAPKNIPYLHPLSPFCPFPKRKHRPSRIIVYDFPLFHLFLILWPS